MFWYFTEAMRSVDNIVTKTNPIIKSTKLLLDKVKREMDRERHRNPTAVRIDENHFRSATKKYQTVILQFQKTLGRFRDAANEDFTRQARIVNPEIEQEQIQKMLESQDPAEYMKTHIMAISPNLLEELEELEEEHEKVQKLEKSMEEIQELFNACYLLVLESGERLDDIEKNVDIAVESAEKGNRMVKQAETYAKQTRKTKFYTYLMCFGCCGIIALVLVLVLVPNIIPRGN